MKSYYSFEGQNQDQLTATHYLDISIKLYWRDARIKGIWGILKLDEKDSVKLDCVSFTINIPWLLKPGKIQSKYEDCIAMQFSTLDRNIQNYMHNICSSFWKLAVFSRA